MAQNNDTQDFQQMTFKEENQVLLLHFIHKRLPKAFAFSLRINFCILPVDVFGISSNMTVRGAM